MRRSKTGEHVPVLVKEAIEWLKVRDGEKYIDATVGEGGHATEIIKKGGRLLAIDRDPEAVERTKERLEEACSSLYQKLEGNATRPFTCVSGNFKRLKDIAVRNGFFGCSGVLFDLGVSSLQLNDPEKGLSFAVDAPLDMRLDPSAKTTAREIVNRVSERKLYEIFTRNAQENLARPISQAILRARHLKPIETTGELAGLIEKVVGGQKSRIHPATKVFLALRIEVNDEIENLKQGLQGAMQVLSGAGRLVVISFHETEDRLVKNMLKKAQKAEALRVLTKKPKVPSSQEMENNPRARSAKLRAAQKI